MGWFIFIIVISLGYNFIIRWQESINYSDVSFVNISKIGRLYTQIISCIYPSMLNSIREMCEQR